MGQPAPDVALYEKLMMVFPGYRGYKERELIRETDRVVRDSVYRRLKAVSEELKSVYRVLVSVAGAAGVDVVERFLYSLDSLAERVRHAPYGYRPLFHVVKIGESRLREMLEVDLALGAVVEELERAVRELREKVEERSDTSAELRSVERALKNLESKLAEREEKLLGLGVSK
ncbi:MAG: hypothetical protein RMI56_02560 [Sulfolobales archaeon]|nr:hypothetical protein [Sulfolobales archaeon]